MHQTETLGSTGRKRAARKQESLDRRNDGIGRKHPGLEMKPSPADPHPDSPDRKRVETVVETLATLRIPGETLA